MAATRYFSGLAFKCVAPGFWQADGGLTLREEMRGTQDHHDWVAERREGDEIAEHYGIGLTLKEAARHLPAPRSARGGSNGR